MDAVLVISQIIALLCLSALCLYLIAVLVRLRDLMMQMQRDMKDITTHALPVMENLEYITSRVRSITENIDDQVLIVRESVGSIRDVVDQVVALERKVQERIEGPILDTVAFIAAVFKGVRTFVERVRA